MFSTSLILFLSIFAFEWLSVSCIQRHGFTQICYDHPRPWQKNHKVRVECELEDTGKMRGDRVLSPGESTMKLQFQCNAASDKCEKVKATFDTAFQIISNVVVFREPLIVNASFISFCKEFKECDTNFRILGSAGPARTIVLIDEDGRRRAFPQALLKQKGYSKHPKFSSSDIIASFNSDVDFWFKDEGAIRRNQSDFLFVIIHELIHGLGISSSWMDYIHDTAQALTPNILVSTTPELYIFGGFVENMFDKFLVEYPSLKPLTETVNLLDQFASGPGTIFNNEEEFNRTFYYSPQYKLSSRICKLATTPQSLAFVPRNATMNEPIILETSLSPYIPGSSISHFDFRKFTNSPDFLMRFMEDRGVSLEEDVIRGGNYVGGPIGPQLTSILETLGYTINPNPKPLSEFVSKVSSPSTSGEGGVCVPYLFYLLTLYTLYTYLEDTMNILQR